MSGAVQLAHAAARHGTIGRNLDLDRTGRGLNPAVLRWLCRGALRALRASSPRAPPWQNAIDTDGDGVITYDEFMAYWKRSEMEDMASAPCPGLASGRYTQDRESHVVVVPGSIYTASTRLYGAVCCPHEPVK